MIVNLIYHFIDKGIAVLYVKHLGKLYPFIFFVKHISPGNVLNHKTPSDAP